MMDKFLQNNTVLRIIALVLACALWLMVNAPVNSSTSTNGAIPFSFQFGIHAQTNDDMLVTSISPPTVTVRVNSTVPIDTLSSDMLHVKAVVNAMGLSPGQHSLRINLQNMPNVGSYEMNPQTVTVILTQKVTVTKPVHIQIEGTPASGYAVGKINLQNQLVQVTGPAQLVNQIAYLNGIAQVAGSQSTQTEKVNLMPVDPHGNPVNGVQLNPSVIQVTIPIEQMAKSINLIPEITGVPAAGYAISNVSFNTNSVTLYGPNSALYAKQGVLVPVPVGGISQTTKVSISIPLPTGIHQIDPSTVQAMISVEASINRQFSKIPISVENVPAGMNVTIPNAPTVTVQVVGPASVVQSMTAADIHVAVDASKLQKGDTFAPLIVQVPNWVTVSQISQSDVPVQIS